MVSRRVLGIYQLSPLLAHSEGLQSGSPASREDVAGQGCPAQEKIGQPFWRIKGAQDEAQKRKLVMKRSRSIDSN